MSLKEVLCFAFRNQVTLWRLWERIEWSVKEKERICGLIWVWRQGKWRWIEEREKQGKASKWLMVTCSKVWPFHTVSQILGEVQLNHKILDMSRFLCDLWSQVGAMQTGWLMLPGGKLEEMWGGKPQGLAETVERAKLKSEAELPQLAPSSWARTIVWGWFATPQSCRHSWCVITTLLLWSYFKTQLCPFSTKSLLSNGVPRL